jgi:ABC-type multidrug transport system fused ATPase/permease subunit
MILDDATSAVDPEVEARILASLRDDVDGTASSLVVVAYRKATISLADEVVHVEDGRVVGRGTHEDLLDSSPAYAQLVNAYEVQAAIDAGDVEGSAR